MEKTVPTNKQNVNGCIVSMLASAMAQVPKQAKPAAIIESIGSGKYRAKVEAIRELYKSTLAETSEEKKAKRAVDALKKNLPAIQWSGNFSRRGDQSLTAYSGLLCADLDHLDETSIVAAFAKAAQDKHVFAAFRSPTDTGLKVVFRVAGNSEQHLQSFHTVAAHVRSLYGLEVDEACKNIERLCFVSHDPEAFINEQAEPLQPATVASSGGEVPHVAEDPKPHNLTAEQIKARRKAAADVVGTIDWQSDIEGFFECPDWQLHSTETQHDHTRVIIDGTPTISCWHSSCKNTIARLNKELRDKAAFNEKTIGLLERLNGRRFNIHNRPPEAVPRFLIGKTPISTPGNLTVISAGVKSGKSSFVGAMMAATITPEPEHVDCLGVASDNDKGQAVIHLDTEQSVQDHFALIELTLRRAGLTEPPAWLESYCVTGFTIPELRHCLAVLIQQAKEKHGGIHSIFLDGAADFVADVNDPEECNAFVAELHAMAIAHDCPIVGLIHFNPNSEKTRGHLGSQLERKAETNLRLDKDGESIVVWSEKNRRAPITKDKGPRFTWSDEYRMHVSTESAGAAKAAEDTLILRHEAEAAFAHAEKDSLSWSEFLTSLMRGARLKSESGARKRLEKMVRAQVVIKNLVGRYTLTA